MYCARSLHVPSTILLLGAVTATVVACSARAPRAAFTDDQPTEPAAPTNDDLTSDDGPTPGDGQPPKPNGDPSPAPACKKAPPSNACGVAPQCGCGANETCDVPDASGQAVCVAAGSVAMGQPCTRTSSCAQGLTCIFGTCHAFCDNPGRACALPGTYGCEQIKTTEGDDVPNLSICRTACAPHEPSSCGGKTTEGVGVCYADGKGGTDCQSGSAKIEGDECSPKDACGPGLVCTTVKTTSKSTCKKWCRVGQADCGAGNTCNGFNPEVKVGAVVYGACP